MTAKRLERADIVVDPALAIDDKKRLEELMDIAVGNILKVVADVEAEKNNQALMVNRATRIQ